ncbi:CRISPR-associated endoribonuclease Cas2 3 [Planctomycetales bacterium]|nr:CRISPR-associated endoribonuclease Cas2 3 [Planctomycetales bacterium]
MYYTVSYDITDNKRRRHINKILLDYGQRVQYSVFEMDISEKLASEMKDRLAAEIDSGTDSIRIYPLCNRCKERVLILGAGELKQQEELFVF